MCVLLITRLWEGWALVNRFNHTSWVTAVTPTDRPKSVHNSCAIKVFGGVFMLSRCFLDCSVGVGVLSQDWVRSLPFSLYKVHKCNCYTSTTFENVIMFWNAVSYFVLLDTLRVLSKLSASLMRNYFPKRPSCAPFLTFSNYMMFPLVL